MVNPDLRRKPRSRRPTLQVPAENAQPPEPHSFRIVAIGASAGGLDAIQQFFTNMPSDTGMAFVVVQHLDPTAHSSMPEILARFTKMTIKLASDELMIEPNSVYLIPPSKSMEVHDGALYLHDAEESPGLRLPVDFFFRSLAKEKGPDAVCVVLSGTGSDGTLGLKAVKAEGGTVFVQDPLSARYDGMPRSAINTGLADFVLKADQMPEKLLQLVTRSATVGSRSPTEIKQSTEPLRRIFAILRASTGHDFSRYKDPTVRRRIDRRMSVNQITSVAAYATFLSGNDVETRALMKDLLISVTNFFRDPEAFEVIKLLVNDLVKEKPQDGDLRVWVPGCATGEEAYSIAMVVSECMSEVEKSLRVQIYGTDIDVDALRIARKGDYPASIVADVSRERLDKFFVKRQSSYTIKKEMRERVVFAAQDLIKDPPFSRMDLICCRNLLIYFESDAQKSLLPLLQYALNPGGLLFLGPSETVGDSRDLFTVLDKKWKIYRRREGAVAPDRLRFPAVVALSHRESGEQSALPSSRLRIPELAEKMFLNDYAPTFAVIDERHRLVYVRGRTGNYLEISSGEPSLSILEMARQGLRTDLSTAVYQATSEQKKVVHEGVRVEHNGSFSTVDLSVAPLAGLGVPHGLLLIVFDEAHPVSSKAMARPSVKGRRRSSELEDELRLTRENLQAAIEELEAANEEMKSANEELQSNNEELQSTNEELETSREELQSLNEELNTVNAELQDRNELVSKANDDLNNFVNRSDVAIILLDDKLRIRSYTPAATDVFNMRSIDVGRPLDDVGSRLVYETMTDDLRGVLRTLQPKVVEVQRKDGHWYSMRVTAYRTSQNVVNGLVMSLVDINDQKTAAETLRETRDFLDNLFNYAGVPIIVWNRELRITRFNNSFEHLTGRSLDEMLGKKVDLLIPPDKRIEALKHINRIVAKGEREEAIEIPVQHVDGSVRTVIWNAATLFGADGKTPVATIASGQDITERKRIDQVKDDFIGMVSHEIKTPMTVVIGAIGTIMSGKLTTQQVDQLLGDAAWGAEAMADIVDNLLELSRWQSNRLILRPEAVDIGPIINRLVEQSAKRNTGHRFVADVLAGLPTVNADPVRAERILDNLIDNAVKYSPDGGEVRISARKEANNVLISVRDVGIGISEAGLKKLFEPFERLEPAVPDSAIQGVGLGLVVCKHLVEAHGGTIWAESVPGKGSTFHFTLAISKGIKVTR